MTPAPTVPPACLEWRRRLAEAESALASSRGPEAGAVEVATLRAHAETCPACRSGGGSRLSELEARRALRSRSVPDGVLEGFYESLEAEARMAPLGGGMSLAFLDAPRSLRMWRTVALGTGLLLALGIAWATLHGVGPRPAGDRPLHEPDARATLLPAWEEGDRRPDQQGLRSRPLQGWDAPTRAVDGFYLRRPSAQPASLVAPPPADGTDPAWVVPQRPAAAASDRRRD